MSLTIKKILEANINKVINTKDIKLSFKNDLNFESGSDLKKICVTDPKEKIIVFNSMYYPKRK